MVCDSLHPGLTTCGNIFLTEPPPLLLNFHDYSHIAVSEDILSGWLWWNHQWWWRLRKEGSEHRCKLIIGPEATVCLGSHSTIWLAMTIAVGMTTAMQVLPIVRWNNLEEVFISWGSPPCRSTIWWFNYDDGLMEPLTVCPNWRSRSLLIKYLKRECWSETDSVRSLDQWLLNR